MQRTDVGEPKVFGGDGVGYTVRWALADGEMVPVEFAHPFRDLHVKRINASRFSVGEIISDGNSAALAIVDTQQSQVTVFATRDGASLTACYSSDALPRLKAELNYTSVYSGGEWQMELLWHWSNKFEGEVRAHTYRGDEVGGPFRAKLASGGWNVYGGGVGVAVRWQEERGIPGYEFKVGIESNKEVVQWFLPERMGQVEALVSGLWEKPGLARWQQLLEWSEQGLWLR